MQRFHQFLQQEFCARIRCLLEAVEYGLGEFGIGELGHGRILQAFFFVPTDRMVIVASA